MLNFVIYTDKSVRISFVNAVNGIPFLGFSKDCHVQTYHT